MGKVLRISHYSPPKTKVDFVVEESEDNVTWHVNRIVANTSPINIEAKTWKRNWDFYHFLFYYFVVGPEMKELRSLFDDLFSLSGVVRVSIVRYSVVVFKNRITDWRMIKPEIEIAIEKHLKRIL